MIHTPDQTTNPRASRAGGGKYIMNISLDKIISGVVVLLLIITFFQAVELSRLKGYVQASGIKGSTLSSPSVQQSGQNPVRQQGSALPSQVGGC